MKIKNLNVKAAIDSGESLKLDLGCGNQKLSGYIGIDAINLDAVDIVCDLNKPITCIPDSSVISIKSHHCLEHITNLEGLMNELHRICKPEATIEITVPHFSNPYFYSDPTHVRFFGVYSMNYYSPTECQPTLRKVPIYYTNSKFIIQDIKINLLKRKIYKRLINPFLTKRINRNINNIEEYEAYSSWRIPADSIYYRLKPIK